MSCLTSRTSEDPSTDNMANGTQQCSNLNDSTFTIIINDREGNYVEKSLF